MSASAPNSRTNSRRIRIKVKKPKAKAQALASNDDDGGDDDNKNSNNNASFAAPLSESAPSVMTVAVEDDDDDDAYEVDDDGNERHRETTTTTLSTSAIRHLTTSAHQSPSCLSSSSSLSLLSRPRFSAASIPMLSSLTMKLQQQFAQLEALAEGFQISGWQFVSEQNEVTITRTDNCEPGFTCSRGVTRFESSPDAIYELISNVDSYRSWTDRISATECRVLSESSAINRIEFSPFWLLSGRDICFLQTAARQPDSTILLLWVPIDDDKEFPLKSGCVRADVNTSGFVIQPLSRGVTGPNRVASLCSLVLQFNMKAWVPGSTSDGVSMIQGYVLNAVKQVLKNSNLSDVTARISSMSISDTNSSESQRSLKSQRDACEEALRGVIDAAQASDEPHRFTSVITSMTVELAALDQLILQQHKK